MLKQEKRIMCDTCGLEDFHKICQTCIKYKIDDSNGLLTRECINCTHSHPSGYVKTNGDPYPCLYEENVETRTFECPKDGSSCKMSLSYCHFECEKNE